MNTSIHAAPALGATDLAMPKRSAKPTSAALTDLPRGQNIPGSFLTTHPFFLKPQKGRKKWFTWFTTILGVFLFSNFYLFLMLDTWLHIFAISFTGFYRTESLKLGSWILDVDPQHPQSLITNLVGGWPTLWKIWVRQLGLLLIIPNIWKNKTCSKPPVNEFHSDHGHHSRPRLTAWYFSLSKQLSRKPWSSHVKSWISSFSWWLPCLWQSFLQKKGLAVPVVPGTCFLGFAQKNDHLAELSWSIQALFYKVISTHLPSGKLT